jgi:hypothetical protein
MASAPNNSGDMDYSPAGIPGDPEARHSGEWYGDALRDTPLQRGDRMFIRCEGGPCISRLEVFPPRIEVQEKGGLYVLVDEGPLESWLYKFVATIDHKASPWA